MRHFIVRKIQGDILFLKNEQCWSTRQWVRVAYRFMSVSRERENSPPVAVVYAMPES